MTQFPGYDKFKFLKLWCFISQSVEHFMLTKILKSTMAWKGRIYVGGELWNGDEPTC